MTKDAREAWKREEDALTDEEHLPLPDADEVALWVKRGHNEHLH